METPPLSAQLAEASPPSCLVVGGGLAGLAAAEAAVRHGWRVWLVEASARPGGMIVSERHDGWLVEHSADSFLASRREAIEVVERLGLCDALIGIRPECRRALVVRGGRLLPVPRGFRLLAPGSLAGLLTTPLLSPIGRLRVLLERFVPARPESAGEESLADFSRRRLGREAFERLVQPLAGGIWTADPHKLGMAAACGDFLKMERDHGSLWAGEAARLRAAGRQSEATGARYGQFVTLAEGLETLPRAWMTTIEKLGVRRLAAKLERLEPLELGYRGHLQPAVGGDSPLEVTADAVVLAVAAPEAARLVGGWADTLAGELGQIEYAGSAVVSLGVARGDVDHPLDAAGLVVPAIEGRRILAVSFSSSKFPGRAPEGSVLMRVFIGGALDPAAARLDDASLEQIALEETRSLLGVRGRPQLMRTSRWEAAMPQYHVGHLERVARIMQAASEVPGLALAGAAYEGVGIPQVIGSGSRAALRAIATSSCRPRQPAPRPSPFSSS